ncbi:MAG: LacI family DNA-binding transcriptional regulator [Kineosporiaceae bacterium]
MRDVAARAGVSLKTVSRVINREPGVSATLVQRVEAAAAELDFRPNLGARSLRRADGKTATIGLVLQDLANPYSAALHRAVEDIARARGVAVLSGSVDETTDRERELITAFSSRRVDGLVIMPTGSDHAYLMLERRAGVAMVFVDRPPHQLDADVILAANRDGARDGVAHLIAHGHRDIAFLGDLATIRTAEERFAGYVSAMTEAGLPMRPDLLVKNLDTADAAKAATERLLALPQPPTALFGAQNLVTIGALRALRDAGRQHEVALVGFDDFELADLLQPAVTVVAQDPQEIGHLAAERLFARLDGDDSPFHTHVVTTRLIVRGSGEIPPPR